MAGADGHRLDHGTSFHRLVLFRVDEVEDINQRGALVAFGLRIRRQVIIPIIVVFVFVQAAVPIAFVVRLVYYAFFPVPPPPSPRPPLLPCSPFRIVLFLTGILMKKEYCPVLIPHMGLIWEHELGKHVLVACDGYRILVFHDRPAVNVEGGHENVFNMVLGAAAWVLGPQFTGPPCRGIGARVCAGGQRAVLGRCTRPGRRSFALEARVRGLVHLGGLRRAGGSRRRDCCEGSPVSKCCSIGITSCTIGSLEKAGRELAGDHCLCPAARLCPYRTAFYTSQLIRREARYVVLNVGPC